jgi:N4-gp56 family major capsid protein
MKTNFMKFDLQMYAANSGVEASNANVQTTLLNTTGNDLSPTMKTFYRTNLLKNARAQHYFNQFGQKQPLPRNNGRKVEWRKFDTFAKAMTPLTEGVTPDGNTVNMTKIEAELSQYGDYTTVSDLLELEAVDPVISAVTEEHGAQAGDTLDTITRNELITGTNVIFGGGKTARNQLTAADILTPTIVNQAFTFLKKMKAPTINGKYIAIIHPSVAYDLRQSSEWIEAHKYAATTQIFNGEIGELHGCRFIEDSFAPVLGGSVYKNKDNGVTYATYLFGKDAFGIIDPEGGNLEMIVHDKTDGTGGPLNQFGTVGYKFEHNGATILYPERMLRIMSTSSYSGTDEATYTANS